MLIFSIILQFMYTRLTSMAC